MNNLDSIILSQLNEERAPVTTAQFNKYREQVDFVFNLLQQQIVSLDVTCGLLLEKTNLEPEAFKAEVARRVKAVSAAMVQQQKSEKKVQLV